MEPLLAAALFDVRLNQGIDSAENTACSETDSNYDHCGYIKWKRYVAPNVLKNNTIDKLPKRTHAHIREQA